MNLTPVKVADTRIYTPLSKVLDFGGCCFIDLILVLCPPCLSSLSFSRRSIEFGFPRVFLLKHRDALGSAWLTILGICTTIKQFLLQKRG
jgi:hypothetical protein